MTKMSYRSSMGRVVEKDILMKEVIRRVVGVSLFLNNMVTEL